MFISINPQPTLGVPWQAGIHCQRFFEQRHKSQYFEVQFVETGPRPTPRLASRTDQFKAVKQEMQRAFEKAEKEENRRIKATDETEELMEPLKCHYSQILYSQSEFG
ncbi:hypothetical protein VE03_10381 [Pseudogymnoascus sp. 23342-1-I1]|nr:hypothetical protein VE03_10381 [Pseudogymnoascus sp. 23342-1-I1]